MITVPPSALSESGTSGTSPLGQPKPSPENLLMAAATMHSMGKIKHDSLVDKAKRGGKP